MDSKIIDNILKSDFISLANIKGYDVFDKDVVLKMNSLKKSLELKNQTIALTDEETDQLDICKSELGSLLSATVIDDKTLKKDFLFFRKSDYLEKAASHKYFKREGTPGNYKYYYTEAQYKKEKGISDKKGEAVGNKPNEIAKQFKEISTNPNAEHKINGIVVSRESANDVHAVLTSFESEKERNDFIGNKSIGQIIVDAKKELSNSQHKEEGKKEGSSESSNKNFNEIESELLNSNLFDYDGFNETSDEIRSKLNNWLSIYKRYEPYKEEILSNSDNGKKIKEKWDNHFSAYKKLKSVFDKMKEDKYRGWRSDFDKNTKSIVDISKDGFMSLK